ncbi:hypothetical protein KAFR_0H01360 [Kazachstania africana CBS 2517]|uniref:Uroporphyrinogen decarboxylase n=1 Tax=Kazachstania africana (strain ATCC 22294 / BCRC 22015 / CBS 2517 / CECT 1963 / NBRC 1671 / NRRL Y-8276) TaxID=1071382 RepID=H2AYZ0_KAZAF|nr:hypothetical protein KAFR_0H01360 [Kazachstania africana CBS 2517]CCF59546.1 hypothetical protein KAFR_0H01360 [Kazachstania africana CBS 2517]
MTSSLTIKKDFPPLKNDLILRTLKGETVERPPCWIMRQAGRYLPEYHEVKNGRNFFELCQDAELASEVTLQPIRRYEGLIDAAIIFSDILVIPQAMGMNVEMIDGRGPVFQHPIRTVQDIEDVLNYEVALEKSLLWAFDSIRLTRMKLNGEVPLFGFIGAPWTLLVYMVEGGSSKIFRFVKELINTYPELIHKLLNKITDVAIEFLCKQVVAGAQLLQVFESWGGELSSMDFDEFSLPYLKRISETVPQRLKEYGVEDKIPMIIFAKNSWYALDKLCGLNFDAVSLDWSWDPTYATKINNGRVTLQGNLDPGIIYGSEEIISKKVEHMITSFGGGKRHYIVNFGHGTHPFMDPEKIRFFLQECHRIGSQ